MNRPIIFTGSQVPLDAFDSDGPMNLYTACRVAMKGAELPETVVVFGRRILRAVQTTKSHDFEYEGMKSSMAPELGVISETVELYHERIRQSNWKPGEFSPPDVAARVLLIELMPGLEPELYEHTLELGLSGIILQTLGAGNVSDLEGFDFTRLVERAWHKFTIPVLVTSKVPVDPMTYTRYERGVKAIDKGAVPAMNMTSSAAAAKFRWVLADTEVRGELNRIRISIQDESSARRKLRELIWCRMREDIAGETATEWELKKNRNSAIPVGNF
jgi:L-asparaginase